MSELPSTQHQRLLTWASQATAHGWLPESALQAIDPADAANPGQLFDDSARPLVAGLFGGTGVGKSTLLNRLAGQEVAHASAERPTSRDITVFVHRSISVDRLPAEFPMQRMRTALHNNDNYRQIMFIDMPDFDSVEQSNRALVESWLPHLDVVIYVVSPERYRDDLGWQLLQQHANEHAWLFVINQWDRGDPAQRTDFINTLEARGLSEPVVFCTDCAAPEHAPESDPAKATDDFPQLQQTLVDLSDQQVVHALQKYGVLARLQLLKSQSDVWLRELGDENIQDALTQGWLSAVTKQRQLIHEVTQLPIEQAAQDYVDNAPFWRRLLGLGSKKKFKASTMQATVASLCPTITERLDTFLTQFVNQQAHQNNVPFTALSKAMAGIRKTLDESAELKLQNALSHEVLHPGRAVIRKLYSWLGRLCLLLPLAALGWVSYRVVSGFAAGSSDPSAYLNSSFAINGALLIGVSWLLPAIAHTYLKPSTQEAAKQGLRNGVDHLIDELDAQTRETLDALANEAEVLRSDYHKLWREWPSGNTSDMPEAVQRMLSDKLFTPKEPSDTTNALHQSDGALRVLDVRANTQSSTEAAPQS